MAEGIVSSPAFSLELVGHRTSKLTAGIPEISKLLRSSVFPELLYISSCVTELFLRLLLRLALEFWSFDRLLRLSVLFSPLRGILFSSLLASSELARLSSLSIKKDSVNNGRSDRDLTEKGKKKEKGSDREEDNRVSSENKEGRLDDDGIEVPDRRAGETPGPSTIIPRGISGPDNLFESAVKQWLRDLDVNSNSVEKMLKTLNPTDLLTTHPLFNVVLTQEINNMHRDFSRLLEMNSELGSEELKVCCSPICWNPAKRLEFFCLLSDRLLLKARASNQQDQLKISLVKELESNNPPILGGQWNDKIDPNFRADSGNSSQCQYKYKSVVDLLRFIRNNWRHRLELPEEFKLKFTGHGGDKCFYDYFDERFPNFLIKTYRAAYRFCREETWFENFC